MSDIELKVQPEGNELIIREGKALSVEHPTNIKIEGVLSAPSIWYQTMNQYDYKTAYVLVDVNNWFIELLVGGHANHERVEVIGRIKDNPALEHFGINHYKRYTTKELVSLLKMNRIHFVERDENTKLVTNLQKFKVRVTKEIEDGNDLKGNKKISFEQQVKHELDLKFKLRMPLFNGAEAEAFDVEINFDIQDSSAVYWLESADLKEKKERAVNRLMEVEIEKFKDLTVIHI